MKPSPVHKRFSKVYIEISNVCNLQCDFCPEVLREKKVMSYELFTRVIDQVRDLTDEVTFHLMGEPMTHPRLHEFIDYCEKAQVLVNFTTNGTLLKHKERAQWLLSPAIRQVNISLQSFTANFSLNQLEPYLESVFAWTKLAMELRPDLYINYRLWNMGSEEDTLAGNRHFLLPIQNAFQYQLKNNVDVAFKKSRNVQGRLYLHFDSRFDWPNMAQQVRSETGYCYGLKSHFAIHADGTVVPCCLDKEAQLSLGQVSALSVLEILNSKRAQSMREGFDQFELRESLCQRCDFVKRFDKKALNALAL